MTTFDDLEKWCSRDRLAYYLVEAKGNPDLGVRLYEWNAELCAAFMEVTHHVEVVLRNRLHDQLSHTYPDNPMPWYKQGVLIGSEDGTRGDDHWIREAERRIRQGKKEITVARVIAQLPFGFWNDLFSRRYEALWRTSLHSCFKPHGPGTRGAVAHLTSEIRLFRNRLAHHERLIHRDLRHHHDDLLKLVMWIDPDARDWVAGRSRVVSLIAGRPT